jgi:hypothetical protein
MKYFINLFLLFIANLTFANGLELSDISYNTVSNQITFTINWSNAWKVPTTGSNYNSDGAWVFVKYAPNGGSAWQHLDILNASTSDGLFNAEVGNNGHGVMLIPDFCLNNSSCSVINKVVTLTLDNIIGVNPDFKVFAFEMVKVPSDPFYLGDGVSDKTYHTYPDTLDHYYVNSSDLILVGTNPGELARKDIPISTDIPADFPKGYREFWVMKYKISQEQYVEFLNTLDRVAQNNRTDTDISGSSITERYVMTNTANVYQRNAIKCDEILPAGPAEFYCDLDADDIANEPNDGLNLIANHLSNEDFLAFLDWAALRPFSKMEYEKLCRGPLNPVAGEYAWGSSTFSNEGNIINEGEASEIFDNVGVDVAIWPDFYATGFAGGRCGFAATSSSTRLLSGATFYGIQDVHSSGSFFFTQTVTNISNFHYFNSQGDGVLSSNGNANVPSWQLMNLNISPSYFHDSISDGNNFTLTDGSRASYSSGQGCVILQP